MTHPYWLPLGIVLLTAPMSSTALESTVGGSLKEETSWTALTNRINVNAAKIQLHQAQLDQVAKCAKKKRFYAPGSGADSDGCVAPEVAAATPSPPPPPPPAYTPSPPPPPAAPSCSPLMGQSCGITHNWVGPAAGCGGNNCQELPAGWWGGRETMCRHVNAGVYEVNCTAQRPGTYNCSGQCQ